MGGEAVGKRYGCWVGFEELIDNSILYNSKTTITKQSLFALVQLQITLLTLPVTIVLPLK